MINIHIVFGDPPDFKDRDFSISDIDDREYFIKWFWKFVESGKRFGVFPTIESDNLDS